MSNNTYTWEFPVLEVYKQQGDQTEVVYNIHWRCKAETGSFFAENYGSVAISPYNSASAFIPFDQLTKEIVTGWVVDAMGTGSVENMQRGLDDRIKDMIDPPTQSLPPPWRS